VHVLFLLSDVLNTFFDKLPDYENGV